MKYLKLVSVNFNKRHHYISMLRQNKKIKKIPTKYRKIVMAQLLAIAEKIQSKRKKVGLTQEALAEELNISAMTLQFIEQGRTCPSLPMLLYICAYLKINIALHTNLTK